jgi:hypothetical protein
MPVFRLQPADSRLDHPAWAVSWKPSQCYVIAENAAQARRYANGAFTIPLQSETRVQSKAEEASCKLLPWSSEDLVLALEMNAISEFGPMGSVELDLPRGDTKVSETSVAT